MVARRIQGIEQGCVLSQDKQGRPERSDQELILDYAGYEEWRVSPAAFIEENRYICYYSDGQFVYQIENDRNLNPGKWSEPKKIPVSLDKLYCWHLDVIPSDQPGKHEMLLACYPKNGTVRNQKLYYCVYDSMYCSGSCSCP